MSWIFCRDLVIGLRDLESSLWRLMGRRIGLLDSSGWRGGRGVEGGCGRSGCGLVVGLGGGGLAFGGVIGFLDPGEEVGFVGVVGLALLAVVGTVSGRGSEKSPGGRSSGAEDGLGGCGGCAVVLIRSPGSASGAGGWRGSIELVGGGSCVAGIGGVGGVGRILPSGGAAGTPTACPAGSPHDGPVGQPTAGIGRLN